MYKKRIKINGVPFNLEGIIVGVEDPSEDTEGNVGQYYYNQNTDTYFKCTSAENHVYSWSKYGTDSTLTVKGAAADAKAVGYAFKDISESTANLFDPAWLDRAEGIARDSNGYWTGKGSAFDAAFNIEGGIPGLNLDSSKRYYFAMTAYCEPGSGTTSNGLRLKFLYTGESDQNTSFTLDTTTPTTKGMVSLSGKTLLGASISAPNVPGRVWYVKDVIIVQSDTAVEYFPHNTAYDRTARNEIDDAQADLQAKINQINTVELPKKAAVNQQGWDIAPLTEGNVPINNIAGVHKYVNNLIRIEDCVNNEYVKYQDGTFEKNKTGYFRSGYIPVTAGVTYKASYGRNIAWYDANKEFLSGVSGTGIQSGLEAPSGAAYLVITVNKSSDHAANPLDFYAAVKSEYSTEFTIPGLTAENADHAAFADVAAASRTWCYGKTINWIGDSIVAGADFDEKVCAALGLVKPYEYGINGSTIAQNVGYPTYKDPMCVRYADMADNADIIAVSGGTNDWMYAWTPVGSIGDPATTTTFYGALKTLCEGLIAKYPEKVIFFTTPIKRAQPFDKDRQYDGDPWGEGHWTNPSSRNYYGKTLGDYADMIKEVCGLYSIPVLDMYRESMLNPHLDSQLYLFDNVRTHPTEAGQKMMARRVAGWLTQLGYAIS